MLTKIILRKSYLESIYERIPDSVALPNNIVDNYDRISEKVFGCFPEINQQNFLVRSITDKKYISQEVANFFVREIQNISCIKILGNDNLIKIPQYNEVLRVIEFIKWILGGQMYGIYCCNQHKSHAEYEKIITCRNRDSINLVAIKNFGMTLEDLIIVE